MKPPVSSTGRMDTQKCRKKTVGPVVVGVVKNVGLNNSFPHHDFRHF
jgi:hypothetical protein